MGKKLDAILGRNNFKTYKFKALSNLAVSRLAIFKNQRQAKLNHARSDVLELLRLGHRDRALQRAEHVIKEQNMLEVYGMMEDYCNLLVERVHLLEQERVCPDELKEAISSLLFASSRCGDFPELHEMRLVFTSRYGKEFAASAVELRNNCGVNRRMMQKMSTRQPDLETRTKLLREIAAQNNIAFELDDEPSPPSLTTATSKEKFNADRKEEEGESSVAAEEIGRDDDLTDSVRARRKYKDVADAAQAAFKSAAYAAEAARAAVELSRSDPRHPGSSSSHHSPKDDDGNVVNDSDDGKRQLLSQYYDDMDSASEDEEADVEIKAGSEVKSSSSSLDPENLARKLDKDIEINYSDIEEDDDHQNTNVAKSDMHGSGEGTAANADTSEQIPTVIQSGVKVESVDVVYPNLQGSRESRTTRTLNILKAPFSVRTTRHVRGY